MVDDPRDRGAYRIAITMLGLSFIVAIAGVCWVAAEHKCLKNIPTEIWFLPAGIGGVFVGLMIPLPFQYKRWWEILVSALFFLALVGVCALAIIIGLREHRHHSDSSAFYAVGATIGAVLLGLPIPAPSRRDR